MTNETQDEAPLDPATERLRRKMVRLLAIAVATMMLGVMAVLAAVVYKVKTDGAAPDPNAAPTAITLPQGARIEQTAISGDTALLTLTSDGIQTLVRIDLRSGAILQRYQIARP